MTTAAAPPRPLPLALVRYRPPLVVLLLSAAVIVGIAVCISPLFGEMVPSIGGSASDFISHVAIVAAAVDTWRDTGGLPISSDAIHPGIEYPYILFGNPAFYLVAGSITLLLQVPPYLAVGVTLAAAFALGTCGAFLLAVRAGLNPYLSVALGFLYASGPYLSLNLFVRSAFPEYLTWQVTPALLLALGHSLRPRSGVWGVLVGALALAAPFYLHKLIAPHLALALAILAFNGATLGARTVLRLGLSGIIAILLSVPGWYPAARGLDVTMVNNLGGAVRPGAVSSSLVNLFWPWAVNSLTDQASFLAHEGQFTLQLGLVPLAGLAAAVLVLVTRPRLALARRLPVPLFLFAVYVALILGVPFVWDLTPSPLRYLQFTYRLIGLAHLVGFLLLIQSCGPPPQALFGRIPAATRRAAVLTFVALAALSATTYWHRPPSANTVSAQIEPSYLGIMDWQCAFCQRNARSSLTVGPAVDHDGWLTIPPYPISMQAGAGAVILSGVAPPRMFEGAADDLVVRVFGFTRRWPEASTDVLWNLLLGVSWYTTDATNDARVAPITYLHDKFAATHADPATAEGEPKIVTIPGAPWSVIQLAETSVAGPSPFELRAPLSRAVDVVALECSRATAGLGVTQLAGEHRDVCVNVEYLAVPNEGDGFTVPQEIPISRRTRLPLGTVQIDARDLPAGHYILPTFTYSFLRVVGSDGSPVMTYDFDRRPVIRHTGRMTSYTASYDFRPELFAVIAGLLLFAAYACIARLIYPRLATPTAPPGPARRAGMGIHGA